MEAYVYKITNKINGKCYIGQTTQKLKKRWSEHCRNKSFCKALKAAIDKYGRENFEITVLEVVEYNDKNEARKRLNELESELIKRENSLVPHGYNITRGGHFSPNKGVPSPRKGQKLTKEHIANIVKAKTGLKYGPKTPEQIEKTARANWKKVLCVETGQVWDSVKACAEHFGVKPKQISRVLRGQRKRLKRRFTLTYESSNLNMNQSV